MVLTTLTIAGVVLSKLNKMSILECRQRGLKIDKSRVSMRIMCVYPYYSFRNIIGYTHSVLCSLADFVSEELSMMRRLQGSSTITHLASVEVDPDGRSWAVSSLCKGQKRVQGRLIMDRVRGGS